MTEKREEKNKDDVDVKQDVSSESLDTESQDENVVVEQNDEINDEVIDEESQDEVSVERDLEAELAAAIAGKDECHDKMMRMAADLENYKKRMIRERDNTLKYAGENIIRDLLPTIDNLGRALDHDPGVDVKVFMEGVDMTMKGLLATLEKAGLTPLTSVGESFDPNIHEAMVMEASKDVPEQHVISEFEKGYKYKDRLLRAAKVIVSKGDV